MDKRNSIFRYPVPPLHYVKTLKNKEIEIKGLYIQ